MFVGLIPWLVLLLASGAHGLGLTDGAALAAVLAAGTVLWARRHALSGAFETVSACTFTALATASAVAPASLLVQLGPYNRSVTAGLLTAVTFGSLFRRPLTAEYTRHIVPVRILRTEAFARANVASTLSVGAAALAASFSLGLAATADGDLLRVFLNWLAPLGLALACGTYLAGRWRGLTESDDMAGLLRAALETPTDAELLDMSSFRNHRTTTGGFTIELMPPHDDRGRVSEG